MKDLVYEYIRIMVDILLVVSLLVAILLFQVLGNILTKTRTSTLEVQDELKEYRELSAYDSKEMTGNDIVIALKNYVDKYSIYIELPTGSYAFRRVCKEEPDVDLGEHDHSKWSSECTTVWVFDDLDVANKLGVNTTTKEYVVIQGGTGGSSVDRREEIYDSAFISSLLEQYLSNTFDTSILRWRYSEYRAELDRNLANATTQAKRDEIQKSIEEYERRKDDIYGIKFVLKAS